MSGPERPAIAAVLAVLALTLVLMALAPAPAGAGAYGRIDMQRPDLTAWPDVKLVFSLHNWPSGKELPSSGVRLLENERGAAGLEFRAFENAGKIGFVMAVDSSQSMKGRPMEDAKRAVRAFMLELKPTDEIAVVDFDSKAKLLSGFTSDRDALWSSLEAMAPEGQTVLYDALSYSLGLFPGVGTDSSADSGDAFVQRNVIVLTDGQDHGSRAKFASTVAQAVKSEVKVYPVLLGRNPVSTTKLMRRLAEDTGGRLLAAPDSRDLALLYSDLGRALRNQFELAFRSELPPDSKTVNLWLAVDLPDYQASWGSTYANPGYRHPLPAPSPTIPSVLAARFGGAAPAVGFAMFVWGVFGAAFLAVYVLLTSLFPPKSALSQQIRFYERTWRKNHPEGGGRPWRPPALDTVTRLSGDVAAKRGFGEDLSLKLAQCGLPVSVGEFMVANMGMAVGLGLVIYVLTLSLAASALAAAAAGAAPVPMLDYLKARRSQAFHEALPQTLTLISGALKAGYSFLQAVDMVVEETLPPMSTEFRKVLTETRLGLPLEEALGNMARRVGSVNFDWTVMAVNIQRDVGGNLAEVLDTLAATIRDRDRVGRQIKVLTAEGRLSAIILFVLPFMVVVSLSFVNPDYLSVLWSSRAGLALVGLGLALMAIGGVWLKRVVTIEV